MADHPFAAKRQSFAKGPAHLQNSKKTFSEAHYVPAGQDSKKRCHECKFYEHPGNKESSCAKVIGVVSADGVCDLFSQRNYAEADRSASPSVITIQVQHGQH